MLLPPTHRRRGVVLVESAVIYSVALLLVLGLIVGGVGMYRYQEVAHLAREGARFAATHGGNYQKDGWPDRTGVPAITSNESMLNYLLPRALLLDPSQLQVTVSWTAPASVTPANSPSYVDPDPTLVPPGQKVIQNNVRVTVSYQWMPEVFLVGPINLTSTSQMPMSY
jgi:Flp pilus assembly protein TadG